jgi:hypothetical protein
MSLRLNGNVLSLSPVALEMASDPERAVSAKTPLHLKNVDLQRLVGEGLSKIYSNGKWSEGFGLGSRFGLRIKCYGQRSKTG